MLPDAETVGLCILGAIFGALLTIILLDPASRKAVKAAYDAGRQDGFAAGRASLFPRRLGGGDHG